MLKLAAALLLVMAAAPPPEQAALLEQLKNGKVEERRVAVERLGEIGDDGATSALVQALRDPDATVRSEAHDSLWAIWHRSGDPDIDIRLGEGIALMQAGRLPESVAVFSDVIAKAPGFAEGWNKRATVHYLAGDYRKSLADCAEVVKRNPSHFGALSGYGQVYFRLEDYEKALQWWHRALEVNPNMTSVAINIKETEALVKKRRGRAI